MAGVSIQQPVRDGAEMLRRMDPARMPGRWVFRSVSPGDLPALADRMQALFHEPEGPSVLLPATQGDRDAMAQITLQVHSALDGVGLSAAVSGALAGAGIPCNIIAATRHDHIFVPENRAAEALEILHLLSRSS